MVHASAEQIQTHAGETGVTEETLWERVCAACKNGVVDEFIVANIDEFYTSYTSQEAPLRVSVPCPGPLTRLNALVHAPPWGGTLPPYLSGPPVFLLQHAARTIFVALEMKVRDPSIRRCLAWPPYYEFPPASSFRTADRKYIMWTASHSFVPAACARTRTVPAFSFAMCGRRITGRRRIPLGLLTFRSWTPNTVNTTRTCISSVRHRSRTVCSP